MLFIYVCACSKVTDLRYPTLPKLRLFYFYVWNYLVGLGTLLRFLSKIGLWGLDDLFDTAFGYRSFKKFGKEIYALFWLFKILFDWLLFMFDGE